LRSRHRGMGADGVGGGRLRGGADGVSAFDECCRTVCGQDPAALASGTHPDQPGVSGPCLDLRELPRPGERSHETAASPNCREGAFPALPDIELRAATGRASATAATRPRTGDVRRICVSGSRAGSDGITEAGALTSDAWPGLLSCRLPYLR